MASFVKTIKDSRQKISEAQKRAILTSVPFSLHPRSASASASASLSLSTDDHSSTANKRKREYGSRLEDVFDNKMTFASKKEEEEEEEEEEASEKSIDFTESASPSMHLENELSESMNLSDASEAIEVNIEEESAVRDSGMHHMANRSRHRVHELSENNNLLDISQASQPPALSAPLPAPAVPPAARAPMRAAQVNGFMPEHQNVEENRVWIMERERDEDVRFEASNCPLCWEEQPYIADDGFGKTASTGMVDRVRDFRKVIFRFEKLLSGNSNDNIIFKGMLELRRKHIESYLDDHGCQYRRWNISMLRNHYDPVKGHRFDALRDTADELQDLRRIKRWIMEHAMFVPNPEEGGEPLFNMRAVPIRLQVSREFQTTLDKMEKRIAGRAGQHTADARMIMQAVNDSVNRKQVVEKDTTGIATMYEIGGL